MIYLKGRDVSGIHFINDACFKQITRVFVPPKINDHHLKAVGFVAAESHVEAKAS
jgi:hypothetical protein